MLQMFDKSNAALLSIMNQEARHEQETAIVNSRVEGVDKFLEQRLGTNEILSKLSESVTSGRN